MATLQKQYLYKITRAGSFLGVLQVPVNQFGYSQNINTPGTSMDVSVGINAFTAGNSVDYLMTEDGDFMMTEDGDFLVTERTPDVVGNSNSKALIRKYNDVEVYEFSPNNPNGKIVFKGYISRWKASFGGGDIVNFTILSYGAELNNYLIQGLLTLDQSFTSQDTNQIVYDVFGDKSSGWNKVGQTFTVGVGVTSISAILVKLAAVTSTPVTVEVKLFNSIADYFSGSPLSTASQVISNTSSADYTFQFPSNIPVNAGQQYFFSVTCTGTASDGAKVYYNAAGGYTGGDMQQSNYGGGSGGGSWGTYYQSYPTPSDLYFKTYYTGGATSSPFNSQDPTTMLTTIIDSYVSQGGTINYSAGTTDATATTRSYTFKINTILEGIQKCLELAPSDWYWYVDPATNILYFKETTTTADHRMILGRHIKQLDVEASVEQLKNVVYFSGGDTGSGQNLFTSKTDSASLAANNIGLQRISDNRVTLQATADAIMQNFLDLNSDEVYNTTIEILETTYDITTFKLGQNVAFGGFGNFVDQLLLQIVGITRTPDSAQLKLGVLPKRATATIEAILAALNDLQTIDNPSAPS